MELKEITTEKKPLFNNRTHDLNLAAALSNAFFPVRIDATFNVLTSEKTVLFSFPGKCRENKRSSTALKAQLKGRAGVNYEYQPEELALVNKSLTACRNLDHLRRMKKENLSYTYDKNTWTLRESKTPLPGTTPKCAVVKLLDDALVCVLMTLGYPLLKFRLGSDGGAEYIIGIDSVQTHQTIQAHTLIFQHRDKLLDINDDLPHMLYALAHKRELEHHVQKKVGHSLLFSTEDMKKEQLMKDDDREKTQLVGRPGKGLYANISENSPLSGIKRAQKHVS